MRFGDIVAPSSKARLGIEGHLMGWWEGSVAAEAGGWGAPLGRSACRGAGLFGSQ